MIGFSFSVDAYENGWSMYFTGHFPFGTLNPFCSAPSEWALGYLDARRFDRALRGLK